MTVSAEEGEAVRSLLAEEAHALDNKDWKRWLALFHPEVEYWVPSWDSEDILTDDPSSQISLMYYDGRSGLEDRVYRIETNRSSASLPLPRTCHLVSNILVARDGDSLVAQANWSASAFRNRSSITYFGHYHYLLITEDGALKIRKKKIVVCNDLIDTSLDIYNI
tara:strand:- start:6314 stop:6808 length:495 start_codon:yes stop_codon:yes gene_type:complete